MLDIFKPKSVPGFVQDSFDHRDVWVDELFGGTESLPKSFKTDGFAYKDQGLFPFCVAMACVAETQRRYAKSDGKTYEFSQPHLFFNAGGNQNGSSIRDNLDVLVKNGAIKSELDPLPANVYDRPDNWYETMRKNALGIPFKDAKLIQGYARVICNEDTIKQAIMTYGACIVPVAAYGDYFKEGSKRTRWDDNHVVLVKGWDDDLNIWYLHDSLFWKTAGEHTVDKSYAFQSAFAIADLPENWREIRDAARSENMVNALDHYGQKRSLELEITVANEMLKQFKSFNNQSVLDASGRFWTTYINAIAYGGYTYKDVVNSCYNWRRTGQQLFDFDHQTRAQWAKTVKGLLT